MIQDCWTPGTLFCIAQVDILHKSQVMVDSLHHMDWQELSVAAENVIYPNLEYKKDTTVCKRWNETVLSLDEILIRNNKKIYEKENLIILLRVVSNIKARLFCSIHRSSMWYTGFIRWTFRCFSLCKKKASTSTYFTMSTYHNSEKNSASFFRFYHLSSCFIAWENEHAHIAWKITNFLIILTWEWSIVIHRRHVSQANEK